MTWPSWYTTAGASFLFTKMDFIDCLFHKQVLFNLANQFVANGLFSEAMSSYQQLIKNRTFANIGRLRLNIANLHFRLGQYALALKQYRMALDQVPAHFTTLR